MPEAEQASDLRRRRESVTDGEGVGRESPLVPAARRASPASGRVDRRDGDCRELPGAGGGTDGLAEEDRDPRSRDAREPSAPAGEKARHRAEPGQRAEPIRGAGEVDGGDDGALCLDDRGRDGRHERARPRHHDPAPGEEALRLEEDGGRREADDPGERPSRERHDPLDGARGEHDRGRVDGAEPPRPRRVEAKTGRAPGQEAGLRFHLRSIGGGEGGSIEYRPHARARPRLDRARGKSIPEGTPGRLVGTAAPCREGGGRGPVDLSARGGKLVQQHHVEAVPGRGHRRLDPGRSGPDHREVREAGGAAHRGGTVTRPAPRLRGIPPRGRHEPRPGRPAGGGRRCESRTPGRRP